MRASVKMKKLVLLVCLLITDLSLLSTASFSDSKTFIVFFFRADENYGAGVVKKGNTQVLAEFISANLKAHSFHIETLKPYPKKYKECMYIALKEKKGSGASKIAEKHRESWRL